MKISYKLFLFLFLSVVSCQLSVVNTYAISEFETSYFINYQVEANGQTSATQEVKLKNRLKNVYATQYSLNIGSTEIYDIKAWDSQKSLNAKVENLENSTNITVFLEQKVLGKEKEQTFFLSFKTPDFAFIKGKVLEIGIPLLSQLKEVKTYQINLSVPAQFSEATTMLPLAATKTQRSGWHTYTFDKEILENAQGITATFGQTQYFKFNLKYHLKNPGLVPIETQITLPPDTPFQRISYQKLEPKPINVEVDKDGNWLATYRLEKQEKKNIVAQGLAQIFLKPQENFTQSLKISKEDYLIEQPFWQVNKAEIKKLAERLQTPSAIYNYLVNNFIYDYGRAGSDRVKRMGAIEALKNPASAICMEFTDTFIALTRAAGIPAREVNGFAYTSNPKLRPLSLERDVLHAWPEYWDGQQKLWVPIDPTWGNTTGGLDFFHKRDLDHFAFVFHGLSSENPLSPGSFKLENSNEKDINIEFADNFSEELKSKVELIAPEKIIAGTTNTAKLLIKNIGTTALYQKPIKIQLNSNDKKIWEKEEEILILPPFAKEEIELKLLTPFFINQAKLNLVAEFDNQKIEKKIELKPIINFKLASWGAGTALGYLVGLGVIKLSYVLTKRK